jgi:hypothetical protein
MEGKKGGGLHRNLSFLHDAHCTYYIEQEGHSRVSRWICRPKPGGTCSALGVLDYVVQDVRSTYMLRPPLYEAWVQCIWGRRESCYHFPHAGSCLSNVDDEKIESSMHKGGDIAVDDAEVRK